jgi:hypothetical protein
LGWCVLKGFLFWNIVDYAAFSRRPVQAKGRNPMKALISMFALALALAFTGPAFAGDVTKATDKASCDKAGGVWDDTAKKCSEKKM